MPDVVVALVCYKCEVTTLGDGDTTRPRKQGISANAVSIAGTLVCCSYMRSYYAKLT